MSINGCSYVVSYDGTDNAMQNIEEKGGGGQPLTTEWSLGVPLLRINQFAYHQMNIAEMRQWLLVATADVGKRHNNMKLSL